MDKFVIRTKVGDLAKKEVGIKISSPKKKRRRIEKDVITTDPDTSPKLQFIPLKPIPIDEEEKERCRSMTRHYPLPPAFRSEDVFQARACKTSFTKRCLNDKVVKAKTFEFDRKYPDISKLKIVPKGSEAKARCLLTAMADLKSNCVVLIGDSRLEEDKAKALVAQYQRYEQQKSNSVIKKVKARGRRRKAK